MTDQTPWEETEQGRAWTMRRESMQARMQAERDSWPERYPVVAELMALGFMPDAYGNTVGIREGKPLPDDAPVLLPPTKFAYPAGGLAHPYHSGGVVHASAWLIWAHPRQTGIQTPDELRDRPCWHAGRGNVGPPWCYAQHSGTLDEMVRACIWLARHYRRTFIVPDWHGEAPCLPAGQWRELLTLPCSRRSGDRPQLDMFAALMPDPPSPGEQMQALLRGVVAGQGDATMRCIDPAGLGHGWPVLEGLIEQANRGREEALGLDLTDYQNGRIRAPAGVVDGSIPVDSDSENAP